MLQVRVQEGGLGGYEEQQKDNASCAWRVFGMKGNNRSLLQILDIHFCRLGCACACVCLHDHIICEKEKLDALL